MIFFFFLKYFTIRKRGIIVHAWKLLSNSLLNRGHCRLIILYGMSISFKPPLSKLLIRIFSLIFGLLWFHRNHLRDLSSWVIVKLGKVVTEAKCIIVFFWILWFSRQGLNFSSSRYSKQSPFSVYDFWNTFLFHVFCCKHNELQ